MGDVEFKCRANFDDDRGFKYFKDSADYWRTPNEFERDGGGDCEDWAIWWRQRLIDDGIPEEDIYMTWVPWTPKESHIFLLVRDDESENFWVMNILSYDICAVTINDMVDLYGHTGERWQMFQGATTSIDKWNDCKLRMANETGPTP